MKIAVFDISGCVNDNSGKALPWVVGQMEELRGRGVEVIEFQSPESQEAYASALDEILKKSGLTGREITFITGDCDGILAAKKVGIIPAGVTWGDYDAGQMLMAGASYVLTDAEDLKLCLDFL